MPTGSITMAAGLAGIGKSQFAIWAGSAASRGALPGCNYGRARSVIFAASEDSWEMTIGPRLVAAGADMDRIFRVEVEETGNAHARLTLPADTEELGRLILRHDVALVVADPLLSVLDSEVNDYRGKEVRAALDPLVTMADRTRCAVLGLAHFNKASAGGDPLLAIQGAAAFGQLIRAGIGFVRDDSSDDDVFVLSTTKNNLGRDNLPSLRYRIAPTPVATEDGTAWVSRFEFTGDVSDRSVRDIMRDAQMATPADGETGHRNDAEQFIIEFLGQQGGSAPAKEVIAAGLKAGFKDATLTKARFRAKHPTIQSKRQGFGADSRMLWSIDSGLDSVDSHTHTQASMEPMAESTSPPSVQDRLEEAPAECPVCGQGTGWALVASTAGPVCRRCAPGVRAGTNCVDCGYPRDLVADGRCNPCHGHVVSSPDGAA